MGGGVGFELAVNHAERLSRVVLMAPVGAGDKERMAERLASQPEGVTAETWVTNAPQPTAADYEAEMKASRDGVRLNTVVIYKLSCVWLGAWDILKSPASKTGLAPGRHRGVVRAPLCVSAQHGQRAPFSVRLLDGHARPATAHPGANAA